MKNSRHTEAHFLREVMEEMGTAHGFILVRREGTIAIRDLGREEECREDWELSEEVYI